MNPMIQVFDVTLQVEMNHEDQSAYVLWPNGDRVTRRCCEASKARCNVAYMAERGIVFPRRLPQVGDHVWWGLALPPGPRCTGFIRHIEEDICTVKTDHGEVILIRLSQLSKLEN